MTQTTEDRTSSANAWDALWKNHKECWASHPLYLETSRQLDRDGCQSAWVHLASFVDALIKANQDLLDEQAELSRRESEPDCGCASKWIGDKYLVWVCAKHLAEEVKPARCVCSIRNHDDICSKHVGATNVCERYLPDIGTCSHSRACHGCAK